VHLVGYINNSL